MPPEDPLIVFQLMSVEGVMARRVADLRVALLAMAGKHPRDPLSLPVVLQGAADRRPGCASPLAIDPPGGTTDRGSPAAVRRVADALADAGHEVDDAVPPTYARVDRAVGRTADAGHPVRAPAVRRRHGPGWPAFLDHAADQYPPIDTATWSTLFAERHGVLATGPRFFETVGRAAHADLGPSGVRSRHGHRLARRGALGRWRRCARSLPANLLGLPAAVVSAGIAAGLPVGAQLTGPRFSDLFVLDVGAVVEEALGVITPIDPVLAPE